VIPRGDDQGPKPLSSVRAEYRAFSTVSRLRSSRITAPAGTPNSTRKRFTTPASLGPSSTLPPATMTGLPVSRWRRTVSTSRHIMSGDGVDSPVRSVAPSTMPPPSRTMTSAGLSVRTSTRPAAGQPGGHRQQYRTAAADGGPAGASVAWRTTPRPAKTAMNTPGTG
jgi:hypothetical protein